MARVLVVDDDVRIQHLIGRELEHAGHRPTRALDGDEAVEHARSSDFDLAIVDLRLPGTDGVETFRRLRRCLPRLVGILITGFPEYPRGVVDAMHNGFTDYLAKPFLPSDLVAHVETALACHSPLPGLEETDLFEGMVGGVPAMRSLFDLITKVAATDEPVLIYGETGTGKELVAHAIHNRSRRAGRPLQTLNCATAGPESLLESELFGHERGAFTGATERVKGWFETAQSGSLFLDEISELPPPAQAKLLRAIEHHEIHRLGGHQSIHVDVRIIAAANVNLRGDDSRFRRDLFHRLSAFEIAVPPLRMRLADLPRLVAHLLPLISLGLQRTAPAVSAEFLRLLAGYSWPGNVRELQQELKKACMRCDGSVLTATDVSEHVTSVVPVDAIALASGSLRDRVRHSSHGLRRLAVAQALAQTNGNVTAAAKLLGVDRRTVQRLARG